METYLGSLEQSKRLQRAVNPTLVLSIAPLCFIFRRTSKKCFPTCSSCFKSSIALDTVGVEASGASGKKASDANESEQLLLGKGIFRMMVPRRRLT